MLVTTSILLILASGLVGIASGWSNPWVLGLQGLMISGAMSLSTVITNHLSREQLSKGEAPPWRIILAAGLIAAIVAGGGVVLGRGALGAPSPLVPIIGDPMPNGWSTFLTVACCVSIMHLVYRLRWYLFILTYLMPWIIAIVVLSVFTLADFYLHANVDIRSSLFLELFRSFPLGLGWGLCAATLDPAFLSARYTSYCTKPDASQHKPD